MDNKQVNQYGYQSRDYNNAILKLCIEDKKFCHKYIKAEGTDAIKGEAGFNRICGFVRQMVLENEEVSYNVLRHRCAFDIKNEIDKQEAIAYLDKLEHMVIDEDINKMFKSKAIDAVATLQANRLVVEITKSILDTNIYNIEKVRNSVIGFFNDFIVRTDFCDNEPESPDIVGELEDIMNVRDNVKIPTSSAILNSILKGGLAKQDLALFVAGSGVGKTCVTSGFVVEAALQGYKVIHIVLEDKKNDIKAKYLAYITGIPVSSFGERKEELRTLVARHPEEVNLIKNNIKSVYAIGESGKIVDMTIFDIEERINTIKADGFVPDLVVIDYFDRIKPSSNNKDIWVNDEKTINRLLNLAIDYNVALWVASQGGKEAQNPNIDINLDNIKGGVWRTFASQIVIAMQKVINEDGIETTKIKPIKNRYGGKTPFDTDFDNGTCRFSDSFVDVSGVENYSNEVAKNTKKEYYGNK